MNISIIIPVYNVSQYIERCLLSVWEQSYNHLEIIIVDDASPDDSMDKIKNFLNQHPTSHKIKIITHPFNKGISASRNTGIKNATGKYLFFLDSDDSIPKDSIQSLVEYLAYSPDIDMVISNTQIINLNKKIKTPSIKLSLKNNTILECDEIINSFLKKEWYDTAWNKLIKKDFLLEKNGWFLEGIVHEDTLWAFYIAYKTNKVIISNKLTYNYFIHPNSIMSNKGEKNFNSLAIVIEKILSIIPKKDYNEKKDLLCTYLTSLKIYFLKSLISYNGNIAFKKDVRKRINNLYSHPLFMNWKRPFSFLLKEELLNIIINLNIKK